MKKQDFLFLFCGFTKNEFEKVQIHEDFTYLIDSEVRNATDTNYPNYIKPIDQIVFRLNNN